MKKINLVRFLKRKYISVTAFFFLSFCYQFSNAQVPPINGSLGALPLTEAQYDALPRPNWDTLMKYSPNGGATTSSLSGSVILNSPPVGDQQTQGSCVGWAVGYTAMGILTYQNLIVGTMPAAAPAIFTIK